MLPVEVTEYPNLPLSIIGRCASGKTSYLTSMLHEFEVFSEKGLEIAAQTDETLEHYQNNCNQIYEYRFPVYATSPEAPFPQIWSFKSKNGEKHRMPPCFSFTLYDFCGELCDSELYDTCRILSSSKAVILTLDLLPALGKKGLIDKHFLEVSRSNIDLGSAEPANVVKSMVSLLKKAYDIPASKKLDVPVAVVFTKMDAVLGQQCSDLVASLRESHVSVQDSRSDLDELRLIDATLRRWLHEIKEDSVMAELDAEVTSYSLFGISCCGTPPQSPELLPDQIKPFGVLGPVCWLFHKLKFFS